MRVAFVSHSLVAERQAAFAAALRAEVGSVLEVFPERWGRHHRETRGDRVGYRVSYEGDMTQYRFPLHAWEHMRDYRPDVLLLQQEAYCATSVQAATWCKDNGVPLVTFNWENLHPPPEHALLVLGSAALNIFGNTDAQRLAAEAGVDAPSIVLPQVGLDEHAFTAEPGKEPSYDIGFFGRALEPMKGEPVLDRATAGQGWLVWKANASGYFTAEQLVRQYRNCIVQCTPSLDVPGRPREQFAPAVTLEGVLCGTPVVTTDQAAVVEWLRKGPYITRPCPAAWYAAQGDAASLRRALSTTLLAWVNDPLGFRERGLQGRAWAVEHFSNQRVAHEYAKVIEGAIKGDA